MQRENMSACSQKLFLGLPGLGLSESFKPGSEKDVVDITCPASCPSHFLLCCRVAPDPIRLGVLPWVSSANSRTKDLFDKVVMRIS